MNLMSEKYQQALAYLTINSSFVADLGLFHGRMGIVLFFAHYGRAVQENAMKILPVICWMRYTKKSIGICL